MSRFPVQETPALDRRPEPERKARPDRVRERSGHRRNHDPSRERIDFNERKNAAIADVGHYRVVAVADLVKERFGGNPFAARAALDQMKKAGLVLEHEPKGPQGQPFKVLTATEGGAREAARLSASRGLDPEQRTWADLAKPKEIQHDLAIYRAGRQEQQTLEARGATVRRVRIDAELKAEIATRSEAARSQGGRQAANLARRQAAEERRLPIRDGQVQYPDAQLEYLEPDGLTRGHVNLEIVSGNYRAADIAAKAAAGFQMHGNGSPRAQSLIAAAATLARSGGSSGGGGNHGQRGKGLIEL